MTGTLFICERPGAGVAWIPLRQIKNAFRLKLTHGGRVEEHDLKGHGASTVVPGRPDGDPVITMQIEEPGQPVQKYPLADWPKAVAVTVSDMLFWLEGGRWRLDPDRKAIEAKSLVEAQCCPDGYDLPYCWASENLGRGNRR
jgi:hypothetical protein